MIPLFKHQQDILDLNPSSWLFAWGTGTAKTRASIQLADKNCKTILVIVPKALPKNWLREIALWSSDPEKFTVMTKEKFRAKWQSLEKFDCVICDESHHFAGFRNTRNMSQLHKSLFLYMNKHQITYRYCLTATPYLSSPMNIFALARILGYNWNYMSFKKHFFYEVQMGRRIVPMVRPHMEEDIKALVNQLGNTVSLNEIFDVPEQIFETVNFELTQSQYSAIKGLHEPNFIVRFTKIHQIENGTLKGDEYTQPRKFDCLKNDYIASVCEENSKVAIFCRYTLQIEVLKEFLETKFPGRKISVIQGDTIDRDTVVREAEAAENCIVIINMGCSEGYELPSIGVVIYASLDFSLKSYVQSQGRFLRANHLKKNVFIHLVSGEVDQGVYDSVMKKQDFHIELFAKNHQ